MYWETKAASAQGLYCIVGAPEMDRKGEFCPSFRDTSPLGMISSVSQRVPLWALGSRAMPVRQNKTKSSVSTCKAIMWKYTLWKLCSIGFIAQWKMGQWQIRKDREKREIPAKLFWAPLSKNICRRREEWRKQQGRGGEENGNRPFTTLKKKKLWSERKKIFTQGISSGSLCACRALVPWLHFKAQVAQLEPPPGQA